MAYIVVAQATDTTSSGVDIMWGKALYRPYFPEFSGLRHRWGLCMSLYDGPEAVSDFRLVRSAAGVAGHRSCGRMDRRPSVQLFEDNNSGTRSEAQPWASSLRFQLVGRQHLGHALVHVPRAAAQEDDFGNIYYVQKSGVGPLGVPARWACTAISRSSQVPPEGTAGCITRSTRANG
jgi:hypothetical protein